MISHAVSGPRPRRDGRIRSTRIRLRRQPEGDARWDRDEGKKCEHAAIHRDAGFRRKVERRQQALNPAQQSVAERDAEHSAQYREQQALGEQHPHQPPTAGTQREAQRDLARAERLSHGHLLVDGLLNRREQARDGLFHRRGSRLAGSWTAL
jgi:hypothetical protein